MRAFIEIPAFSARKATRLCFVEIVIFILYLTVVIILLYEGIEATHNGDSMHRMVY
jgi:hypothetical protein